MALIAKKHIPIILFILVLLCELYLPSYKLNFAIQFSTLIGVVYSSKTTISLRFFKTILPLLLLFLIGFLGFFLDFYPLSATIKDITYFLKPIIALVLSYVLIKKQNDLFLFLKIIVYVAVFTAFIHLFGIFVLGDFRSNSIHELRGDFGLDNFIEIFALYILLFSKRFLGKSIIKDRRWYYVLVIIFLLSIYLYFSRTMLVTFFLIGFSMFGYAKITTGTLKFIGFVFLLIGLLYAYLFSVKIDRNAKGVEAFLYKIKIAPEEIFETKIDRENHKELWDHWRGYEAKRAFSLMKKKPSSYIFGTGYGSLINLKFKAPVGEKDMKFISRIHNGYVYVLYKTGFIGLILYLLFLLNLYLKIYTKKTSEETYFVDRIIVSISIFYFFSSLIITGIYIPIDAVVFILGGLLAVEKAGKDIKTIY
ncbi:hypothetical protein GFJ94_07990 [Flavobacterium sp. LMO8]|uniref:O-antigen ligase family protein n=1 Tax=Flavobacterium sp. LMO8 TaxID=2654244 RepID=UPI0012922BAB|nr:O-antigen ligase family protein [Flavobacterium sp. LMO8]MQP25002.1 hypothetical protein [Flavobacterium sp. LMO8]